MFSSPKNDSRYFISTTQYNCPFCSTASVKYEVTGIDTFNWSNDEQVRALYVQCQEYKCKKTSLHFTKFSLSRDNDGELKLPFTKVQNTETGKEDVVPWLAVYQIDDAFFYHHPNSSFVIDKRIPEKIRLALDEAETSQKMNLQIGASASLRKAIFQLLAYFQIPKTKKKEVGGKEEITALSYLDRLVLLKEDVLKKHRNVDESLLDGIKQIYSLVSMPLHERLPDEVEFKDFNPEQFRFLAGIVHSLLIEIFVENGERLERSKTLATLAELAGLKGWEPNEEQK